MKAPTVSPKILPEISNTGTILKGLCMGTADVIPGVSGGTIALILGIYARLINAIRAFDSVLLMHLYRGKFRVAAQHIDLVFLLFLGLGIITALLFFTRIVPLPILIRTYPMLVYGLFFGLLVASIGLLIRDLGHFGAHDSVWILLGIIIGYWLVSTIPMDTPEEAWFIFISGALAICAMILPGISGAFVLLILKKYTYLLEAIGRLDFGVLVPFILGAIVGVLLFSRFLAWLLKRFHRRTFLVITGILIGSLWIIWPFQERVYQDIGGKSQLIASAPVWPQGLDAMTMAALGLILVGVAAVTILDMLVKHPRIA